MIIDKNIHVRANESFFSFDYVDISLNADFYDFYDYSMGKLNIGRDFNTSGSWLEMGYQKDDRPSGKVFSTSVQLNI